MRRLIYRRDNISIALKQNELTFGCNLNIWYGYIDNSSKKNNFIVDASVIKEDMRNDLQEYDHICFDVNKNNDIVDSMIDIGQMIFKKAMSHQLMSEIILEDIYGDKVIIQKDRLIIHKAYLHNLLSNYAVFSCYGKPRHVLYGLPFHSFILTCHENITEKELQQLLMANVNNMQYYITYKDEASSVALTYYRKERAPEYITICCIEHLAHQLPDLSLSEKCGRLHGHAYCCYATIRNANKVSNTSEYVLSIGEKVRTYLRAAFNFGELSATTTENVISYVAEKLCNEYELTFIELSETPNIKARIYLEEATNGEIV